MGDALILRALTARNSARVLLTLSKFSSYTRSVRCRIISGAFLGVWLVLLAGDFCDDLGLFDDDDGTVDQALDGALSDFGQAIDTSDHSDTATWLVAHDSSGPATSAMLPAPLFINETSFALLRSAPVRQPAIAHNERRSILLL